MATLLGVSALADEAIKNKADEMVEKSIRHDRKILLIIIFYPTATKYFACNRARHATFVVYEAMFKRR